MSAKLLAAALAAALLCAHGAFAADAQDCALKQIASLPITTLPDGSIAVSAKLNDTEGLFAIELAMGPSGISSKFVEKAGWDTSPTPSNVEFSYGDNVLWSEGKISRQIKGAELQIGALDAKDLDFLILPRRNGDSSIIGSLGSILLRHFDVEFDFANARMNLFSQDHCEGNVVYWAKEYTALPLKHNDFTGEVTAPMTLDGHVLTVSLSTLPSQAFMFAGVAAKITGIPMTDMTQTGSEPTLYSYPFKTLSLNGLTLQNPSIILLGSGGICEEAKVRGFAVPGVSIKAVLDQCATDLTIGLRELRKLHLYFAFGEGKLYVTAADARK